MSSCCSGGGDPKVELLPRLSQEAFQHHTRPNVTLTGSQSCTFATLQIVEMQTPLAEQSAETRWTLSLYCTAAWKCCVLQAQQEPLVQRAQRKSRVHRFPKSSESLIPCFCSEEVSSMESRLCDDICVKNREKCLEQS